MGALAIPNWRPSIVSRELPAEPRQLQLHATISVTLDTYSHAIPAMREEAALIAGLVFAE